MNAYSLKLVVSLVAALSLLSSNAALAGPKSVTVGTGHSLAVKSDGSVWGWGLNDAGQLGSAPQPWPSSNIILTPAQVDIPNALAVAAPCFTTHVLKADGTVWAYGDNEIFGVLGNNSSSGYRTHIPVQVLVGSTNTPLTNVVAISAFAFHALALKSDGTVWAWGQGSQGQLGDGTETNRFAAVQVMVSASTPLTNAVAIYTGNNISYAIKGDGTVWAWGWNANFALGISSTTPNSLWAVQVPGLAGIIALAPGIQHYVALKSNGTVLTWGRNTNGELGDGSKLTATRSTPTVISTLSGIKKIATHWNHTLAVKDDGTLWTWGRNDSGQLGDGTTTTRTRPVKVSTLSGVEEIAVGPDYSLVITHDDKAFAWGANDDGQLGAGYVSTSSLFPIQVQGITP